MTARPPCRRPAAAAALVAGLASTGIVAPALAQGLPAEPPGPYVIDLRGATIGLPQDAGFYPPLGETTLVPARGFGVDAGAHVYPWRLGPGRVGLGANVVLVRGTTTTMDEATAQVLGVLAPQLSLNFGTSNGWSYIGGGAGVAHVIGRFTPAVDGTSSRRSGSFAAYNAGGGARWFLRERFAIGFDLRVHYVAARAPTTDRPGTPGTMLGMASAGFSFK